MLFALSECMLQPERRNWRVRKAVIHRVRQSIRDRLAGVCAFMSAGEFEEFIRRAAEIEIKYNSRHLIEFENTTSRPDAWR
jgi:hypothetical protein